MTANVVYLDAQDQLAATPALARTALPHVRKLLGLALAPDFGHERAGLPLRRSGPGPRR